ncbi:MAG TPA: sulfatase-like hydrolase/transferase [Acidobacteriota bacterium]|jgi:arylsulfatase A-like enzyme/Tfp pilus assembly protein PilF
MVYRPVCRLFLAVAALLVSCSPQAAVRTESKRPPNVLLITIDTLRADHVSCYGSTKVSTPHIDALAARGARFERAFAQVPLTPPSHGSIFTGSYPQLHQIRDIGGFVLDPKIPTLATLLKQAGFETAAFVGSAVLTHHVGLNRGFDVYSDDMNEEKQAERLPGVVAEIHANVVTDRALRWLEEALQRSERSPVKKSFFLWAHYYDPHFPYDPPEPWRARYSTDAYAGEVAYTDEQAGRLLDWIEKKNLKERTLVILLSDHGESLGEHGENTHGVFLYDSTMHIPLIAAGPGIPAGKVISRQVRSIDLLPTVADYISLKAGDKVQGVSLLPAIMSGQPVRSNYCYMETLYPKTHLGWSELRGMRTDEWKLIIAPKPELYRLGTDRQENLNVVKRYPSDADRLQKKIWEIAGAPGEKPKLQYHPVDEQTRQALQSLGYVSAGSPRELRIDMSGPDPKDRVEVLKGMDQAADLMNHDRFEDAALIFERLQPADPTNPLLYAQLATCYQRVKQFGRALAVFRKAVENKADTDRTHAEMGGIYVRMGDLPRAIDALEQAAKINATDLQTLENLGNAYLQLGRLDDAQRVLSSIVAQNNRHAGAHNLMGILEIQRGHPDLARKYFEKAIEYNPEVAEPYMNLGLLAQNAGDLETAKVNYRKFLQKANPTAHRDVIPKVRAALADLEQR